MSAGTARTRPYRLTLRTRLTVVYGGLFLLAGMTLLATIYILVDRQVPEMPDRPLLYQQALPEDDPNQGKIYRAQIPEDAQSDSEKRQFIEDVQNAVQADALSSLLTQGGVALLLVSAVAVTLGWVIAGRALQPLQQITATARRIAGADGAGRGLHERISLHGPADEVRQLADTFDLMLERLDRSFDGQRRFVANASHELRTPLAVNRALVELAVTRPGASPQLRDLGENLLEVNQRHERLIDGLLTLADSENAVTERHPVDLARISAHVLGMQAGESPVVVRQALAPAPTAGDPVLLERLTQNLVENAVRHNISNGGWVSVRTGTASRDRNTVELEVTNTGPVVGPHETETIFQPFHRLGRDQRAGRGFGLGLSIVRAVAGAHGGSVSATPRDGGGLIVTVTLPARMTPPA